MSIHISYYDNGKVNYFYEQDNTGNRHGLFCRWFQNGNIAEECVYEHGNENGPCRTYSMDGTIYTSGIYVNSILSGPLLQFNKSTNKLERTDFIHDNKLVTQHIEKIVKDINNSTTEERTQIALQIGLIL